MSEKLLHENINKPKDNKDKVINNSIDERKKLLEGELEKGINIKTVNQFNSLILLLQKSGIISKTTNFNDLVDSDGTNISQIGTFGRLPQINGEDILLTIKKKGDNIVVYSAASSLPIRFEDAPRKGYIKKDGTFEYNPDISFISYDDSVKINEMLGNMEAKLEPKPEPKPEPEPEPEPEPNIDESYTIVKGDTLWKIVKEKYGITDNREIANAVNALVQHNKDMKGIRKDQKPADGIFGDTIIVGKTLKLPASLRIHGDITLGRKDK